MPAKKTVPASITAKPFLKWAGSKRQLLSQFIHIYPDQLKAGTIKNYYEPFLGSGAVFFDVAQRYSVENIFLSDVNADLVLTYKMIRSQVTALTTVLFRHQKKYLALDKAGRLAYFYAQREAFNQQRFEPAIYKNADAGVKRAAQLIFLNRTCFNGLFRVNSTGAFNTPAGDYVQPVICDEDNLQAVSALLAKASIKKIGFETALKNTPPGSFIYFDPPYRPLSITASFTAYSKSAFTDVQQAALADLYRELDRKGALLMLSNSDTRDQFFDNLYRGFQVRRIPAKRLINADASKRGLINEIIVTNYAV